MLEILEHTTGFSKRCRAIAVASSLAISSRWRTIRSYQCIIWWVVTLMACRDIVVRAAPTALLLPFLAFRPIRGATILCLRDQKGVTLRSLSGRRSQTAGRALRMALHA